MLTTLLDWLEDRTGLISAGQEFLDEDVPASSGWHQVFGSVALFLLMTQILTGVLLAINYAARPGDAYLSLEYIITAVTAGALVRGLHHWGSTFMVVFVVLHMIQVAIWGAYKKPREATWLIGVALLLLTLAFGLTGYLLPWDNRAYWATVVTIQIAGLAPGGELVQQLLGSTDGSVGVATFSRFYTLHTVVLPAVTALLVVFHVYLVRRHGVAPQPGDEAVPKKKFYPVQVFKDTAVIFGVFCALFLMAAFVEEPLGQLADPTDTSFVPRPEWYFLFLFELLKYFKGSLEFLGAVVLPTLAILLLAAVPFLDRSKLKRVGERIPAMVIVVVALLGWGGLTAAAWMSTPPETEVATAGDDAIQDWTELPPSELATSADAPEFARQAAAIYEQNQCGICHMVNGEGMMVGPPLTGLAGRHDAESLTGHFRDPQAFAAGSMMPAYEFSDGEMDVMVRWMLAIP
jgi:ubiquinol-cytochrome c reductase cytochrome b subunit